MKCKNPKCNKKIDEILEKFGGVYGCCSFHCHNELIVKDLPLLEIPFRNTKENEH